MAVRIGKPAPEFETSAYINGEIEKVRLSDYRGKWVLMYFYPGDFTFVCPTELTTVATKYKHLQELGAEVLAVSVDSPYTHKAWQEVELSKMVEGGLPFPMLSDVGGDIGRLYGVYDEDYKVDLRGSFLIDPDGNVQAMEVLAPAIGRNATEMLRQLKACVYVRGTGGQEATPAGWEPGKQTLKPEPGLTGKVCEIWAPEAVS
jgi:peroxiredoxin (alkyl hydroperoxide reductase subunit C)